MDLRSEETIRRKREELRVAKGKVVEKRREARVRKIEVQKIDLLINKSKAQLKNMKTKQQEAMHLWQKTDCLKRETDLNCIPGRVEREFHGLNRYSRHKELLQKAKESMQKAINIDKIAQVLEESAKKDKHNVLILGNQMLINIKLREKLRTYKSEISNCEYLLRKLRKEKARNKAASDWLEKEAVKAERLAKQVEEENKEMEK